MANNLAYFARALKTKKKGFRRMATGANIIKHFYRRNFFVP